MNQEATIKAGLKQSLRIIKSYKAKRVFIAEDADEYVLRNFIKIANEYKLEIIKIESMKELGKMCGINIGSAVGVELQE